MKNICLSLFSMITALSLNTMADPAILSQLNTGWPESLQSLKAQLNPKKSYAVMVIKTPLANLDLRNADQLRRSLLATRPSHRGEIGHVLFGWKCPTQNSSNLDISNSNSSNSWVEGFVSQSGERSFQSMQMLDQGWGFSAIFSKFTDGVIFTPAENEERSFKPFMSEKDIRLFTLISELDANSCHQILNFVDAYTNVNPATGSYPFQNFGLTLKPENLEGGGCSSVAVTALAPAGLFFGLEHYFHRELLFPKRLFGRPLRLDANQVYPYVAEHVKPGTEISLFKAVGNPWNEKPENSLSLNMIDIEMMILFTKTLYSFALDTEVSKAQITELQKARAIKRIERRVHYLTTPEQQEQFQDSSGRSFDVVDETYDNQASYLVQSLRSWRANHALDKKIRRLIWNHQVAVVIEN